MDKKLIKKLEEIAENHEEVKEILAEYRESESRKIKTIANCETVEAIPQIYDIAEAVKEYIDTIGFTEIRKEYAEKYKSEDKKTIGKNFVFEIMKRMMKVYPEQTTVLLGMCAFKTQEESAHMHITETFQIFNSVTQNREIMDFFTSLVKSELRD